MKRYTYFILLSFSALILAVAGMTSCEGPAGPAGADGADGMDGVDANATCTKCHNENSDMLAKMIQADNSVHMTGGAFERNDADCAACHTHEGFIERMDLGEMEASGTVHDPTPPNCRTCHMIHTNYDSTDWAISYPDPVTFWVNGVTADLGDGNICANCHQPRIPDPQMTVGGGDISITNSRWGPHHGTQSGTVYGTGGYEFSGVSFPATGAHAHAGASCTTCHMADAFGNQAGGHTLKMSYEYHGSEVDNIAGCTECHSSIEDFDYNDVQTDMAELLDSLEGILVNKGFLNASSGLLNASSGSPLTLTADEAGAVWNFEFIDQDKSMGVHNPPYVKALLEASIDAMSN